MDNDTHDIIWIMLVTAGNEITHTHVFAGSRISERSVCLRFLKASIDQKSKEPPEGGRTFSCSRRRRLTQPPSNAEAVSFGHSGDKPGMDFDVCSRK